MLSAIKKIIVSSLAKKDRKIVRISEQRSMSNFLRHAKEIGLSPKTVIDVGVAYGTKSLYEAFPDAKHFLVEPIVEWEPKLQELCKKWNGEYIIAAAGSAAGKIQINVHNKLSSSSILFESDGNGVDGTGRSVDVVRIDEQCRRRNFSGPYVLKIDVQGFELEVLAGCTEILDSCDLVIMEASLYRFYKDGPEIYEMIVRMKELGFVVFDMFDWHNRPLDNNLAQVDLAFVKEHGSLRRVHNYASEDQRNWETQAQSTMLR